MNTSVPQTLETRNEKNITEVATKPLPTSIPDELSDLPLTCFQGKNRTDFHLYSSFIYNVQNTMKQF